jgi:C4-type Zn-finger protein
LTVNKKIVIGIMIVLSIVISGCMETVSNGKHNGQITAVEKSGMLWQTYNVYVKSDISSSQEEKYCVEDVSLIPKLENFSKERKKVTLIYRDELYVAPWRCDMDREGIITNVEE